MLAGKRVKLRLLLVSALIMSLSGLLQPAAWAESEPPDGICNGVLNQLQERQTVEQNLLEAAARQNAGLILQLEQERTTLQGERQALAQEIAQLEQQLATLQGERQALEQQIMTLEQQLQAANDELAQIEQKIQQVEQELQAAN